MKWKGICFDLDNTLLDYEAAFKKGMIFSFRHFCKHHWGNSENINETDWFSVFKHHCDDLYKNVLLHKWSIKEYKRGRLIETMKKYSVVLTKEEADEFQSFFYNNIHQFVEPFEGVSALFNWLKEQKVEIGLITNGYYDTQMKKIQKLNIKKWIKDDFIFISEKVGTPKPDENIFGTAKAKVAPDVEREDMLFIGDSWELDIVGAIEAGWEAIYLNTRKVRPKTVHKPYAICENFSDIYDVLQRG